MNPEFIFYPVIALAFWTMLILLLIPYRRLNPAINGEVAFNDFELGERENAKAYVALANRNYMSLLEAPVLFYMACLTIFVTGNVTTLAISLAGLYVATRIAHSLIHVTYNHVPHRFSVFVVSTLILLGLLVSMTISIVRSSAAMQ